MKKTGGFISVFGGIVSLIGAFFAKKLFNIYNGVKVYQMDNSQKLIDTGKYLSRSGDGVSFSNSLFWIFLILGFTLIILGVALLVINHSDEAKVPAGAAFPGQHESSKAWKCSACGTENPSIIIKCLNCNADKSTAVENAVDICAAGEWICPNCGKIHQHYVGTCGCGTSKP